MIILKGSNDQAILSDLKICDALAAEFSRNFSSSSYPDVVNGPTAESLFQVELRVHALHKIRRELPNSAAGPDGIPAAVYKRLASVLVRPLHLIFSQSLMQSVMPSAWKIVKVIPLYKSEGDKTVHSSCHLISQTNIACKILERIMVSSLSSCLQDNKLLNKVQYGFQCGKSATTNLLECDSYIADVLNRGGSCDVILFDF